MAPVHRTWCPHNVHFNEDHPQWPYPCPFRHCEYHWPGQHCPWINTLIGDSIIKYVNELTDTYVQAYPGAAIQDIIAKIQRGDIWLSGYRIIIFHVGSNNLHDEHVTVSGMFEAYKKLVYLTRSQNSRAAIVISEIIPRTYEDQEGLNKRMFVNRAIEYLAKHEQEVYFFRTYRAFTYGLTLWADRKFFARDGLHLNRTGTRALKGSLNGNIITLKGKLREAMRKL